tara:strand:+ start:1604 stop:1966 length:363 start_codon:yes stop_codon:yes gene_type:complete
MTSRTSRDFDEDTIFLKREDPQVFASVTVVEKKNTSLLTFLTILGVISGIIQFIKVSTDGSISVVSSLLNMVYFSMYFLMQWNDARYSPSEKRKLVFPQISGFVASTWNFIFGLMNGSYW